MAVLHVSAAEPLAARHPGGGGGDGRTQVAELHRGLWPGAGRPGVHRCQRASRSLERLGQLRCGAGAAALPGRELLAPEIQRCCSYCYRGERRRRSEEPAAWNPERVPRPRLPGCPFQAVSVSFAIWSTRRPAILRPCCVCVHRFLVVPEPALMPATQVVISTQKGHKSCCGKWCASWRLPRACGNSTAIEWGEK